MEDQKIVEYKTPLGVKIISILFFIISLGLLYIFTLGFYLMRIQEIADKTPNLDLPSNFFSEVNIIGVIFSIILIILGIFLWKRANWARISTIIFSALFTISLLLQTIGYAVFGELVLFKVFLSAFALFVVFYITFNKKVRLVFNSGGVPKSTKIFTGIFILILIIMSLGIIESLSSFKESATNYSSEYRFVGNSVYENTHYKFRLTYPIGSIFSKDFSSGFVFRFFLPNGQTIANDQENVGMLIIEKGVLDLEGFLQNQKNKYSIYGPMDIQEVQFGGQKGYKVILTTTYTVSKGTKELYYFTVKDNILYMLDYFPVVDENIKVIDDIAKSFEFIN